MQTYHLLITIILLIIGLAAPEHTAQSQETPTPPNATRIPAQEGELYGLMTFSIDIPNTTYTNPFDPNDIELLGLFQAPSGRQMVVPGFWMQPHHDTCETDCNAENLRPIGEPSWQVRFTPTEAGNWTYTLQVQDGGTIVNIEEGQFNVTDSQHPGFIRIGENHRYFQYENGQPYFPIGHNLLWSWEGGGGLYAYQQWLEVLSANGGNYARLLIDVPWFIGLEWERPAGSYEAAQAAATRLDTILESAAEHDIALQLVLLWHQALRTYNGPPVLIPETPARPDTSADWDNNPYNVFNGGTLSGPSIFFYDPQAQELFRRRLRYIVARWGYSPNILAWELIDEIDQTANYDPNVASQWLQDTASYLRQIDQQEHLITAGSQTFDPTIAAHPLLDFTEGQFYQSRPIETTGDQVMGVLNVIHGYLNATPSPTLLTAFSLNPWFEPTADDPNGIHFQTTLWASALSGAAGNAAGDWWDTYIIPQDLQRYYPPLTAYTSGIDWPNLDLQPAEAGLFSETPAGYTPPVRFNDFNRQFTAPPLEAVSPHTLTPDGAFPTLETVPSYLYGQVYNSQLSQAQRYRVTAPIDTYLEVRVRASSQQASARLTVAVDDQIATELQLDSGSQNLAVRVPLSAGEHTFTLDNLGDDWLELESIEIGHLLAPARALTLRDTTNGVALAWIHHRGYTWDAVAQGHSRETLIFSYRLDGMPTGQYKVDFWDPLTGAVLGEEVVSVSDDHMLCIELPPVEAQLAIRAFLQSEPTTAPTGMPVPIQTNTPQPSETDRP